MLWVFCLSECLLMVSVELDYEKRAMTFLGLSTDRLGFGKA